MRNKTAVATSDDFSDYLSVGDDDWINKIAFISFLNYH